MINFNATDGNDDAATLSPMMGNAECPHCMMLKESLKVMAKEKEEMDDKLGDAERHLFRTKERCDQLVVERERAIEQEARLRLEVDDLMQRKQRLVHKCLVLKKAVLEKSEFVGKQSMVSSEN
eukprot:GHVO01029274.1.p1 GENE.GHVO01029274.1~~GHVO01029274.1.p1  ORF type:complete len:123 (-),score=27.36 GHVO01029274.1:90-458(-)